MKIYCMYGVGVPTERSYYYAVADEHLEEECTNHNSTGCTHEANDEHIEASSEYDNVETKSTRGPHLVSVFISACTCTGTHSILIVYRC